MKSTDSADATARALDILPHGDPAVTDPRFLRAPHLIKEARHTREAAAEVWLAVSPLRVAPPEVLHDIMEEITPHAPARLHGARRAMPWLAAAGWAAAAVIAFLLWPPHHPARIPESSTPKNHNASTNNPAAPREMAPVPTPISRDHRQRSEINRLRQQLSLTRHDEHTDRLPRIIGLMAPGAPKQSPAEVRKRVRLILADALRSSLEAESGAPSDPAAIVIERGWPQGGVPAPAEGQTIRHRHFPEHDWQQLGFLRSSEGEFYDAANQTIWSASPDGRGFIGSRADNAGDLTRFSNEADPVSEPSPKKPRSKPEGFIVENPDDGTADVIIDNLPAPAPGNKQVAVIEDTSGNTRTVDITQETNAAQTTGTEPDHIAESDEDKTSGAIVGESTASPVLSPAGVVSWKPNNGLVSMSNTTTSVFNIGSILNLAGFRVIELPLVPNGQPDKVIVESNP